VKVNIDCAVHAFARPPHNLDVLAAKSMQPNQQEMMPATQRFEKPYHVQSVLKERMQFQPMRAPPGLGGSTYLYQDRNLDDRPPVPEDSNLHYDPWTLCSGLVNNLQDSVWNSPPISGHSPSQREEPAMRGYHSNSVAGIDRTVRDFSMSRFNYQLFGDSMNTPKCNPGGAFAGGPRIISLSESAI